MTAKGADILGPNDMGGAKRPRVNDDHIQEEDWNVKKSKKDKKNKAEESQSQQSVDGKPLKKSSKKAKGKTSNGEDADAHLLVAEEQSEAELTLGQRLELLSKRMSEEDDGREKQVRQAERQIQRRVPTADSLVTLLEQALQSSDAALLEQCLLCTNLDIIDATTQRLPTSRVLLLLKTLVAKFEKRPSRGLLVTHWLSFILKHHISFLITVPDLARQLAGLSQLLEQRLSSFSRLSSLSGRLDLLMSQVSNQKLDDAILEPMAEYQDE